MRASGLALGANRIGALTAQAAFADPKNPAARLTASAENLLVSGVPIGTMTAQASLANHVVTLDSLHATSERAFLEASGRADLNGDIAANLDASDFPLALLDPLLPQPATERRTLTGELSSLSVSASGPTRAPNLTASITLANPGLAVGLPGKPPSVTYALERVRSGAITLTTPTPGGAQVLSITDLAAFQGGRPVASLSGTLPFQWRGAGGALPTLPDGQPLHAQLVVQDLSQLAPFAPVLDPKKTAGTLTASLDVSGAGDARRPRRVAGPGERRAGPERVRHGAHQTERPSRPGRRPGDGAALRRRVQQGRHVRRHGERHAGRGRAGRTCTWRRRI